MILPQTYTREWIMAVRETSPRTDPILIEKMIMAFALVENLQLCGLNFVFKGGTSLALVLGRLQRFSIDIDIVMSGGQNVEEFFRFILEQGIFSRYEEDKRTGDLPKAHYKFFFHSVIQSRESYVLLDILFEENLYSHLQKIGIQSSILSVGGDCTNVHCPTPECLLGDKLTAFAPHTTGVLFGRDRQLEIVKQLFDIASLFDVSENVRHIYTTHEAVAKKELHYRGLNKLTPQNVLSDTFNMACLIGQRGYSGNASEYTELLDGISRLRGFIYSGNFTLDTAILCAAKAALLTALLLNGEKTIRRFEKGNDLSHWNIQRPEYVKLNRLKKTNPEAFYYFYCALEINNFLA